MWKVITLLMLSCSKSVVSSSEPSVSGCARAVFGLLVQGFGRRVAASSGALFGARRYCTITLQKMQPRTAKVAFETLNLWFSGYSHYLRSRVLKNRFPAIWGCLQNAVLPFIDEDFASFPQMGRYTTKKTYQINLGKRLSLYLESIS